MSDPVNGENEEATRPASPETGAESPERVAADAISEAAALAEARPMTDDDVSDVVIADAEIPPPTVPELELPEAVLPASALQDPVIPPAPGGAGDVPPTRAARRALPSVDSLPEPAPIPRDPAVVPPADGATSGGYRGLTIVIFVLLVVLLIAAVATVVVLATTGPALFSAEAVTAVGRAFGGSPA
ncbi:hypothetical protein [Microbacterium esteraromaticum]|uniref:hypothetical protein n=1 Tax=Microbacterium esteraromaticum TaxID=57043 RepID=UPI001C939050|nr:hypothetical protein [Microbacterium esteraromaticum]MBY6062652.1 hypothetical protein [Microbacterium esteraromaticum]